VLWVQIVESSLFCFGACSMGQGKSERWFLAQNQNQPNQTLKMAGEHCFLLYIGSGFWAASLLELGIRLAYQPAGSIFL
jgi:hypothetical protein